MKNRYVLLVLLTFIAGSCGNRLATVSKDAIRPAVITAQLPHDTDDPAIWINPDNVTQSVIIGTDKDTDGALYAFDLKGSIIGKSEVLKRPNNVDIGYDLIINGVKTPFAVTTERETNSLRIFSVPNLKAIDNGGIPVFDGEALRAPMGVALYTRPTDHKIFVIVGRKEGPSGSYLWQYELTAGLDGVVTATLVRKFGAYSGIKEIEAIAVDNELGVLYYCDEQFGIRKYYADPDKNDDTELAIFGKGDFKGDNEGIAIYKKSATEGYLLVSNQQANTFMVYPREGAKGNSNLYPLLAQIPTATIECDGADATAINLGGSFQKGLFVAMSNGRTFHFYDWELLQLRIDMATK